MESRPPLGNAIVTSEFPPDIGESGTARYFLLELKDGDVKLYKPADGHSHESDFIDGIYENRPVATDCEIGHRTTSICILANMCVRLGLSGLKWDPVREVCTGPNAESLNGLLKAPYANGWKL